MGPRICLTYCSYVQKEEVYFGYVTKWVEAKAFPRAIEQVVVDFLYKDIFIGFGIPQEIVTNQGTQFTYNLVQYLTQ